MTMNCSFNAIQNVILIFPDERPVFLREVNNNMYQTTPYFWAKIISEIPFSLIIPTVFGCICYYAVGLKPEAGNFFTYLLILILIYNSFSGYSLIISASFSNKQLAVTLTPVLIVPFMLFAGFFVASANIPWYLKEFEYLSIIKYGYQALMRNQFDYYIDNAHLYLNGTLSNLTNSTTGSPPIYSESWNDTFTKEIYYPCLIGYNNASATPCNPVSQLSK